MENPKPGARVRCIIDGATGTVVKAVPELLPKRAFVDWDVSQKSGWGIKKRTAIRVDELEEVEE